MKIKVHKYLFVSILVYFIHLSKNCKKRYINVEKKEIGMLDDPNNQTTQKYRQKYISTRLHSYNTWYKKIIHKT